MDYVHDVALCFDLFGLFLAYVEIKYPAVADKLEDFIDGLEKPFRDMGYRNSKKMTFEVCITLSILFLFMLVVPWLITNFSPLFEAWEYPIVLWLAICGVGSYTFYVLLLLGTAAFIDFLNRFADGRATGALGIVIGALAAGIDIMF